MIEQKKIEKLALEALESDKHFLVEVNVSTGNVVDVFIDGDEGVDIDTCVAVSRYIEHSLDREKEDFELRVSSPGLDRPFKLRRQYRRFIGKKVRLKLTGGDRVTAEVLRVDEDSLQVLIPKTGKTPAAERSIPWEEIESGKPVISFK
ncbi:MAG: ribosome maturation factor RimP [Bacteroidales bacterium]